MPVAHVGRRRLVVVLVACCLAPLAAPGAATAQTCSQAYLPDPDPSCQPGAINPDVTQSNIDDTICVSGWTDTVRPPTSYTNKLKTQQIAEYGYSDTSLSDYEEDHLIPLELGGAPRDAENLWPEPRYEAGGYTASDKDTVENRLKREVCAGDLSLSDARWWIVNDWRDAP